MPAEEFYTLAVDFEKASARTASTLFTIYKQAGADFARAWADNARATSGAHGKWYPASITSETQLALGAVQVETGPDPLFKQGAMGRGFEFGSENQPPHLDGLRALGPADVKLTRLSENALRGIAP